ncbi:hypothetical protein ceV_408 [Chrysochromulina ericina virus CeV-01B]|uniref:Uncharacterized protein n=1 Tax=Chrysochromulina ericina virus CeV-01B TaxID=3070830 RepID=A0A0N9QAV6_9VIRU|nr:hypothetical protein ceV_408 [Chrysochromulina ericina virus]ALH23314.1 hypothetical protein ceV_408 [Chrysochromulina ericina virus CeV-01B]
MSLAVLKRKTMHGHNPRLAPISGSNNGTFGFSLNGTRRGNHTGRETNLAPGAMTGSPQMIGPTSSNPTGPGIYGHPSSVCTNDPTVVKTTVMNTRGMLAKRLRGIERIPPMAPIRNIMPENGSCPSNGEPANSCGCEMGGIIEPTNSINTQYWSKCYLNKFCTGPLSVNWVKPEIVPNGNQSTYIERIVKINGKTTSKHGCNSTKSFNGIIGVLDLSGLLAIQNVPQGCNTNSKLNLSEKQLEALVTSHSIMPFHSLCRRANLDIPLHLRNCANRTPVSGMENWTATGRNIVTSRTAKPGITTIDYGTYISRRLKINNYIPPQLGCNMPQPQPNLAVSCRKTPYNSYWNNNIPPSVQWMPGPFSNVTLILGAENAGQYNIDGKEFIIYLGPNGKFRSYDIGNRVLDGTWQQFNSNTINIFIQRFQIVINFYFSEPLLKISSMVTITSQGLPDTKAPILDIKSGPPGLPQFKDLPKPFSI